MHKASNILGRVMPKTSAKARSLGATNESQGRVAEAPVSSIKRVSAGGYSEKRPSSSAINATRDERAYVPRRRRVGVHTDLSRVKGILSKVLAQRGLDKRVERYEFILHWREIVGDKLFEVSKPDCIRNRALLVHVLHPVWAQELTFMKPVLLQKLSGYLKPGDVVTDMVFRVGRLDQ